MNRPMGNMDHKLNISSYHSV